MPVNAPRVYAICGMRPNQSIVVNHAVRNGKGLPKLQSHFAADKGCSITCLVDCTPTSEYGALRELAEGKFKKMLGLIKQTTQKLH